MVGIGGVGGYLAGMLSKAYPNVTLAARNERKESVKKNGLILHSDLNGEIVGHPVRVCETAEIGEQDYIFVCVKNYSLEEACEQISPAVGENTVIIPVMNGVDPGDRIRAKLKKGTVVNSLIYIVSFSNPDYSITQQGKFAKIYLGIKNASKEEQAKVDAAAEILKGAGIDYRTAEDIESAIWKKYILNCAFNVSTAYYNKPIGNIRSDKQRAADYEQLVNEAYQVALAKKVQIGKEETDAIIHRFYFEYADNATSSLMRDFAAARFQNELETFSGYIVREARRLGVEAPVSEKYYQGLLKLQKQNEKIHKQN